MGMATLWKCVAEPSGNPPGPPHAACMQHTHTTHAGENSPRRQQNRRACCVSRSISSILRGCCNANTNVSEYMLVLALCLVILFWLPLHSIYFQTTHEANVERVFSVCRQLTADKRNLLTKDLEKRIFYKCSVVAEIGDRLATIDMGRKEGGAAVPLSGRGSWVPI